MVAMRKQSRERWVDIWACMPQLTEPDNLPSLPFKSSTRVFENTTLRQTVKVNLKSEKIRLRLSNEFGASPLVISSASVAKPASGLDGSGTCEIDMASCRHVTFSTLDSITIPTSALAISDEIALEVGAGDVVTISLYLEKGQDGLEITSHPGSRTTSWFVKGDQTESQTLQGDDLTPLDHWYFISSLQGVSNNGLSFVLIGDSITDGRGSTHNFNDRWPNWLWNRLQGSNNDLLKSISPLNLAAGGNRILTDGLGPSAWSRITRDVLAHPNVGYVLIFEGVNDIGTAEPTIQAQEEVYDRLIMAYQQLVTQIHAFDIPVFGATITPFGSVENDIQSYSHPLRDQTRRRINEWIKNSGTFDYVVDFALAVADPDRPDRLATRYDTGDLLHLNPTGFERLAEVFDLGVFEEFGPQ